MMERVAILVIAIVFTTLANIQYIAGLRMATSDTVYLGTVHWPGDYFYYLSQFAQGKEQWFWSYDLYTTEFRQPVLVGWVNVFLGKVFFLLGLSHFAAYQISLILFSLLYFFLAYKVIMLFFPKGMAENSKKRILAVFLFAASNAFPIISFDGGGWKIAFYDYWFNNGLPFVRLNNVPHQMLGKSLLLMSILFSISLVRRGFSRKTMAMFAGLLLSGFVLASVEPVHWVVLVVTLFATGVVFSIHKRQVTFRAFMPSILLSAGGMTMAVYLKLLFLKLPYSQLAAWEYSQNQPVDWKGFILANGPVMIAGLLGLYLIVRKRTFVHFFAVIFTAATIGFFLSPIPGKVGILDARFLPFATTLFLSVSTVFLVAFISEKAGRRGRFVYYFLAFIIVMLFTPSYVPQIAQRTGADLTNNYVFLPKDAYNLIVSAGKLSDDHDAFLVLWPFNTPFSGITGRRVFSGHPLLTIDPVLKEKHTWEFFNGMSEEEKRKLLSLYKLTYVIAYPWDKETRSLSYLSLVKENENLAIYRVEGNKLNLNHEL